jgi:glucose-1-phosphate thymidylyltransferase
MQAVILAAGEGQRLRPFTANKPKVMIKVANKPILEYVVEALRDAGILDIVMVVGYRRSRIMDYFGNGSKWSVKIEYAIQQQQLGTAHALKQAEELISDDEFLVLAGDNIVDSETIKKVNKPWTLAYKEAEEPSKYGVVVVSNGKVEKIIEKPEKPISNLVNTGIYCFTSEIFERIGDQTDLISVINSMIEDGYEFRCVEANTWVDIVYPWDIVKVNDFAIKFSGKIMAGKIEDANIIGDVSIGRNTIIRGNVYIKGPVVIGENCEIGPNAVIMPSTSIGNNVKIGAFSYIENSVIGDNVIIAPNCYIKDSVIDRGCIIKPNFTALSDLAEVKVGDEYHKVKTGVFIGEGCNIGAGVIAEAGTIIGNNVTISSLKIVRGVIPDNSMIM